METHEALAFVTRESTHDLCGGPKLWRDLLYAAENAGCQVRILPGKGWRYLLALARLRFPKRSAVILPYPDLPRIRRHGIVRHAATLLEIGLLALKKRMGALRLIVYAYDLPIEQQEAFEGTHPSCLSRLEERWLMDTADVVGVVGAEMGSMLARHNPGITGKLLHYEFIPYYAPLCTKASGPRAVNNIAFVGNLDQTRLSRAVRSLPRANSIRYTFYGPGGAWIPAERSDSAYAGEFPAEDLSVMLAAGADYGLIFYDYESSLMTSYLSMTTTSKFFCYVCAGLPLLTYRYDHIARLVAANGLGAVFDDPRDLPGVVSAIEAGTYTEMARHVAAFATLLAERDSFLRFVVEALGGRAEVHQ